MVAKSIIDNRYFDKEKYLEYFLVVLFVYCNGSWLFLEHKIPMIGMLICSISIFLIYTIKVHKEFAIPNFIIVFLAFFPFLCGLLNIDKNTNWISVIYIAITYILLGCFTRDKLKALLNKYVNIIYFLAIVSIILNTLFLGLPQLLSHFPVIASGNFVPDDYGYYNFLIYTVRVSGGLRAQSIFWEPGAWSFNQLFAMFWILFITKDSKKVLVIIISIFFTFSTTGIACAVILLVSALFLNTGRKIKINIISTLSVLLILMFTLSFYLYSALNIDVGQLLNDQLLGKFTGESSTVISFEDRKESTQKAFLIAEKNPVFGIGKMTDASSLYVTSSLAELGYQLGLLYLIVFVFVFRVVFRTIGFFVSLIVCIIMLNGEAYSFMILSSTLLVLGAKESLLISPIVKKLFYNESTGYNAHLS